MISDYHRKWMEKSDEQIAHMAWVKEVFLGQIFSKYHWPNPFRGHYRVGVLGCKDRRLVGHHKALLERLLARDVELVTFDITTEHLHDAEGVVQYDVTHPLPYAPFDLLFADILIRFIKPEKQFTVLKNAFNALAPGGMAILAFAPEDVDPMPGYIPRPGTQPVDFVSLQHQMREQGVPFGLHWLDLDTQPPGAPESIHIHDAFLVIRRP